MNAYERMLDFNQRNKQYNINEMYKAMQKKYPALQKVGVPKQVFFPSSDIISVSPLIQLANAKGLLGNQLLFSNASEELLFTLEHYWGLQLSIFQNGRCI